MNDEVERMKHELISDRELQLKNQIEYGFVTGNKHGRHCRKPRQLPRTLATLTSSTRKLSAMAITPEDIRAAAQKYYVPEKRVTPTSCTTPIPSVKLICTILYAARDSLRWPLL